ncbi:Nuclear pore complex protein NUP107 [Camellia lanceoleosa]|uniref:Nuclear pore complex protein NUP107 n=1 Tax=Camellia lanceoleosa TaxID=1840588 RepID=A0ACC0IRC1_9ERIC|nr:Nuclear pore complex protein NUP107 [Camellia lanceoleosa]
MPLQCSVYLLVNVCARCHLVCNTNECPLFLMRGSCLKPPAHDGDGLGPHELNDGGILATVIAAGFKGELVRFQADVTMEISRLDAWYSSKDGSLEGPATYIVWAFVEGAAFQKLFLDVCRNFYY